MKNLETFAWAFLLIATVYFTGHILVAVFKLI
jgi:hypothetical protein